MAAIEIPVITPPAPDRIDLKILQGADLSFAVRKVTVVNNVTTPVDFTGWTARAQIRKAVGKDLYLEIDPIDLDSDGYIRFTIPAATTEGAEWDTRSKGVWDMEVVDTSGTVYRMFYGNVTISWDVTRAIV